MQVPTHVHTQTEGERAREAEGGAHTHTGTRAHPNHTRSCARTHTARTEPTQACVHSRTLRPAQLYLPSGRWSPRRIAWVQNPIRESEPAGGVRRRCTVLCRGALRPQGGATLQRGLVLCCCADGNGLRGAIAQRPAAPAGGVCACGALQRCDERAARCDAGTTRTSGCAHSTSSARATSTSTHSHKSEPLRSTSKA
jgi:hypothetical protein